MKKRTAGKWHMIPHGLRWVIIFSSDYTVISYGTYIGIAKRIVNTHLH